MLSSKLERAHSAVRDEAQEQEPSSGAAPWREGTSSSSCAWSASEVIPTLESRRARSMLMANGMAFLRHSKLVGFMRAEVAGPFTFPDEEKALTRCDLLAIDFSTDRRKKSCAGLAAGLQRFHKKAHNLPSSSRSKAKNGESQPWWCYSLSIRPVSDPPQPPIPLRMVPRERGVAADGAAGGADGRISRNSDCTITPGLNGPPASYLCPTLKCRWIPRPFLA